MSALWIVGLVIGCNCVLFAAGLLWMRRQMRRVAAERASEHRHLFKLEPLPPPGEAVQILVEDGGVPSELDAVHWPHLGWIDARTLLPVAEDIVGWRHHPFRRPTPVDRSRWSPAKLDAELERLAPDEPTAEV